MLMINITTKEIKDFDQHPGEGWLFLLKNIQTGAIGEYQNEQGDDYISPTKTEVTERKKSLLKDQLIKERESFLGSTFNEAVEYLLSNSEYPTKATREQAKREIEEIKSTNTLATLNKFIKDAG